MKVISMTHVRHKTLWLATVALAILILAGLFSWQQSRLQATLADQQLATARAVQTLVEQQLQQDLDARAELIAGNQAFIGYLSQAMGGILPGTVVDTASIVDLLEERRAQLGLTLAAVIDGQGQLIASRDQVSGRRDFASEPLFAQAVTSNAVTRGLWEDEGRVFFVSILPLDVYGSDAGFLLVGTPLDDAVARTIADTAKVQAAVFAIASRGPALAASTLDPALSGQLLTHLRDDLGVAEHRFSARVGDEDYRGYVAPMFGSDAGQLVVLVANDDALAHALSLGMPMLAAAIVCLLLLVFSWLALRRHMVARVDSLARVMERAASTGDYHLQIPEAQAGVLAPLATAFNRLMVRLDDNADS